MRSTLQRLFSTFPDGLPGLGLLLLRLCLSLALIKFALASQPDSPAVRLSTQDWMGAAAGLLLVVGLWTPVVGTFIALVEVLAVFLDPAPPHENTWFRLFLGVLAISLALLGPGAWSIDARLFGRKKFDIDRSQSRKPRS